MADEKLNVSSEENPQPSLFDAGPAGAPARRVLLPRTLPPRSPRPRRTFPSRPPWMRPPRMPRLVLPAR